MTITITAFERSPDGGQGLSRDMRVRWALEARSDAAPALVQAGRDARVLKDAGKKDSFCYTVRGTAEDQMASSPHELHQLRRELPGPRVQRAKAAMISLSLVAASASLGLMLGHSRMFPHRTWKAIEVLAILSLATMMILRRVAQRSR
jgi:hypothetical protein